MPVVSGSEKSGARCPTCGAPFDAGSCRPITKYAKAKKAMTRKQNALTSTEIIFERVGCGRSEAKPRRSPKKSNTPASRKSKKFAHGKSRVIGNQTKMKK